MYLLDPARGKARRHILRDKATSTANHLGCAISTAWEDLRNRANGLIAEGVSTFRGGEPSDEVVEARVRTALGRVAGHPHAIQTRVQGGHVTLSGPVTANELDRIISCIKGVRGVDGVTNQLEQHDQPDVPALQGASQYERQLYTPLSPATRLLIGIGGMLMWLRGALRGGIYGRAQRMLGCGMSACSAIALLSSPAGAESGGTDAPPSESERPGRRKSGKKQPSNSPASMPVHA
jgi:hypothetical protein